jgi:hypothetical protein
MAVYTNIYFIPVGKKIPLKVKPFVFDFFDIVANAAPNTETAEKFGVYENFNTGGANHVLKAELGFFRSIPIFEFIIGAAKQGLVCKRGYMHFKIERSKFAIVKPFGRKKTQYPKRKIKVER